MNRLKQEPSESDIVEDVDEADGAAAAPASGLTNGHNHSSATELKPNVEVSLTEDSLQNVVPTYNNNNSIVPSQVNIFKVSHLIENSSKDLPEIYSILTLNLLLI